MDCWRCGDVEEAREAVAWAAAEQTPIAIQGSGSKQGLGRPVEAARMIDLSRLSGVTLYEPDELVLRAGAGTPLAEIEILLATHNQMLGFEPPDWGPLWSGGVGKATIGGLVATNASGPRRLKAGALRDHLLGIKAINGRGEFFKSGGRVMKNVTGYDLPKLMAGAFGTLGVLTEATFKLMPAPEETRTLVIAGLSDRNAIHALRDALHMPYDISGAAHLPEPVAARSSVQAIHLIKTSVTLLRLEGSEKGLAYRIAQLRAALRAAGHAMALPGGRSGTYVIGKADSLTLWREIRDVSYFADDSRPVWRVSVAPMEGPNVAAAAGADAWLYDWAGGLVWLAMQPSPSAEEAIVRRAVGATGGHATLFRADETVRASVPVFEPEPPVRAALTQRVKEAFDPLHVLNPGRMYAGV